jgi:hypothetical protein
MTLYRPRRHRFRWRLGRTCKIIIGGCNGARPLIGSQPSDLCIECTVLVTPVSLRLKQVLDQVLFSEQPRLRTHQVFSFAAVVHVVRFWLCFVLLLVCHRVCEPPCCCLTCMWVIWVHRTHSALNALVLQTPNLRNAPLTLRCLHRHQVSYQFSITACDWPCLVPTRSVPSGALFSTI